jgi:hypothetical protein
MGPKVCSYMADSSTGSVPTGVKNTLTNGQRIRIYDPWCKTALDGQIVIRIEDYQTIEFV